jgi:hypothetical protein
VCSDGSCDGNGHSTADSEENGDSWVRVPTTYDGVTLTIRHRPAHDACTYGARTCHSQRAACGMQRKKNRSTQQH